MDDELVIQYDIFRRLSQSPPSSFPMCLQYNVTQKKARIPKKPNWHAAGRIQWNSLAFLSGLLISRLFFFHLNLPSGTRTTKDRGPGHDRSFQRACTVRTRYSTIIGVLVA